MLVVRGDVAEFFCSRGPFKIDTDADPDQITLPTRPSSSSLPPTLAHSIRSEREHNNHSRAHISICAT